MRKITFFSIRSSLFLWVAFLWSVVSYGQCINATDYLVVTSNNSGNIQTIGTCTYTSEYNTINGLLVGEDYVFTATIGSTDVYITVTDDSDTVISHGPSPHTVTNLTVTTVRLHITDNSTCDSSSNCHTTTVQFLASCPQPISLNVSGVTTNSAVAGWTPMGSEDEWDIEYGPTGFTQGSGTLVPAITTSSYSITSLNDATTYQFYVRAKCTGEDSLWAGPFAFTTLCNEVTEFVENFDTYPTGGNSLPNCWNRAGTSTSVYITSGGAFPGTPPNRLYMYTFNNEAYAILPPVSNLQANTHRLRLKAYATAADRILEVGYISDPSDLTTYVFLEELAMPDAGPTSAVEFTVVPSAIPAGVSRLVIKNPGFPGAGSTIYVDDVKWEFNSPCAEPTALGVNGMGATAGNLTWTAGGSETEWDVQYGPAGFTLGSGTLVEELNANTYAVSGLTADTNYHFYVRGVCTGDIPSSWSGPFPFRTLCEDVTEFFEDFDSFTVDYTNLPACWTKGGTSTSCYVTTGSAAPMSPSNRIYMYTFNDQNAYAVMPPVSNLSAETHRLRFKAYATSNDRVLEVGYLANSSDVNSFVLVSTLNLPGTALSSTQEFIVMPMAVPAGVKRLAFRNGGYPNAGTTIYIDDVSWEVAPTTPPVCTSNEASQVDPECGTAPVILTWDSVAEVNGYNVTIGTTPGGSDVMNAVNVGNVTSYTFTDADEDTTYYWTVVPFNNIGSPTGCTEQTFTTPNGLCFCVPTYEYGKTSGDLIANLVVVGTTLSNNTGNAPVNPAYTLFTGESNYTANLQAGEEYEVQVTVGTFGNQHVAIWVDFNDDGEFSIEERIGFTTTSIDANGTGTFTISLGCDATVGEHRMRVRNVYATTGADINPCSHYNYGETEDYYVTVVAADLPDAPTGDAEQDFCGVAVIADLAVTGQDIKWYTSEDGDIEIDGTEIIPVGTTTYYASQTVNCESADRLAVEVTVTTIPDAPVTDDPVQTFCGSVTVDDLVVSGDDITWYTTADGDVTVASDFEIPVGTVTYYATQTVGCESTDRLAVEVVINAVPDAPQGDVVQTIFVDELEDATIADIDVTGDNINWYESEEDAMNGENELAEDTILVSGATYYGVIVEDGCQSEVFSVTVTVTLGRNGFDDSSFSYYPNPVNHSLTLQYSLPIEDITVMNMLGQEVLTQKLNATQATVNVSGLAEGTYMVRVTAENQVKYFKIVKR